MLWKFRSGDTEAMGQKNISDGKDSISNCQINTLTSQEMQQNIRITCHKA